MAGQAFQNLHSVRIGRAELLAGLFWQTLSNRGDVVQQVRTVGRGLGFDYYSTLAAPGVTQAGFCSAAGTLRPDGMQSLAAVVTSAVARLGALYEGQRQSPPNWLAVFELAPGIWWRVAVRDFAILPEGDIVGSEQEVWSRFHEDYADGGWNVVLLAQAREGIGNFELTSLDDLVAQGRRAIAKTGSRAMRPIDRGAPSGFFLAALLALGILGVSGALYGLARYFGFMPGFGQRQAEIIQPLPPPAKLPPAPHPWKLQVTPGVMASTCAENWRYLTPAAWQLSELTCDSAKVSYRWKREDTTVSAFLQQMPKAEMELSGEAATMSTTLEWPVTSADDVLLEGRVLLPSVVTSWQKLGLKFQLNPAAARPLPVESGAGPKTQPPDWREYTFSLAVPSLSPSVVHAALEFPGIRVNKIIWKASADWTLEGTIYAK